MQTMVRVLCVFSVLAAATLRMEAQTFTMVKASIPFTMTAGDRQAAAGDYTIEPISAFSDVFLLRGADGKTVTLLRATPIGTLNNNAQTDLVFRRDGGEYRLEQMWVDGNGYQFPTPEPGRSRAGEVAAVPALPIS